MRIWHPRATPSARVEKATRTPPAEPTGPAPTRRAVVQGAMLSVPAIGVLAGCGPTGRSGGSGSTDGATSDRGGGPTDNPVGTGTGSASPPDAAAEKAASLRIDQAAGQLVLVGAHAEEGLPDALAEHGAGGVFLLGLWRSQESVRELIRAAREASAGSDASAGILPLITADQEGGQVRMLRGDAARQTPSAQELGAAGPDAVTGAYRQIGEDLTGLGIGVDLAPVADVVDADLGDANAPVGGLDRGFGTDPGAVADCVEAAVTALAGTGARACLKHFPGLGRVRENTDHSAQGIEDDRTTADDPFLEPFRAGIAAGAPVVMLSSATYTRIDAGSPAMFSRAVVTDLLRGDLGFDGLVVTDDIGSARAVQSVPVAERATRLLEAGGDAVLSAEPDLAGELVTAIIDWAGRSPENEARVRESAARMLRLKADLGLLEL